MRLRLEHGRRDELKTLHPAYFALVMATGIVSIATYLHGIPVLPTVHGRSFPDGKNWTKMQSAG
jgi:hypothetical protein